MIRGAKILAWSCLKIFEDNSICERAKAEFQEEIKEHPYRASLPNTPPKNIF